MSAQGMLNSTSSPIILLILVEIRGQVRSMHGLTETLTGTLRIKAKFSVKFKII